MNNTAGTNFCELHGCSTSHSRNMTTLTGFARQLRDGRANDEHVANNLDRIAQEYSECFRKMYEARSILLEVEEKIKKLKNE